MPWTPEEAKAAASKGGLARAERARARREAEAGKSPQELAKQAFEDASPMLAKEIIDAALGRGAYASEVIVREVEGKDGKPKTLRLEYAGLEAKDRLQALKVAVAYGLGTPARPGSGAGRPPEPKDGDEDTPGLIFNMPEGTPS